MRVEMVESEFSIHMYSHTVISAQTVLGAYVILVPPLQDGVLTVNVGGKRFA